MGVKLVSHFKENSLAKSVLKCDAEEDTWA